MERLQCDDLEGFDWQTLFDKVDIASPFSLLGSLAMTSHVTFAGIVLFHKHNNLLHEHWQCAHLMYFFRAILYRKLNICVVSFLLEL